MSDTHGRHKELDVPDGDILIHAGDFCKWRGDPAEVEEFTRWMGSLPHKLKVAIPGNHDEPMQRNAALRRLFSLAGIMYLQDTGLVLPSGLSMYGSPWTPIFGDWSFMLDEAQLRHKFAAIPDDVDVLITHGGPAGVLDLVDLAGVHAGSSALMMRLSSMAYKRPMVHIFGHIHERRGNLIGLGGKYRAYNVAICDLAYNMANPCTVIEVGA
jgi:Icc-related predicted phosphoesterase